MIIDLSTSTSIEWTSGGHGLLGAVPRSLSVRSSRTRCAVCAARIAAAHEHTYDSVTTPRPRELSSPTAATPIPTALLRGSPTPASAFEPASLERPVTPFRAGAR